MSMSNLQIAIIVFLAIVAGSIVALALVDANVRKSEQEQDDKEQLDAVSRPAALPRRRAGAE
jgi:hypothetical protein